MHYQTLIISNDIRHGKQPNGIKLSVYIKKGYVWRSLNMFYKLSHLKNDSDLCWYELHEH